MEGLQATYTDGFRKNSKLILANGFLYRKQKSHMETDYLVCVKKCGARAVLNRPTMRVNLTQDHVGHGTDELEVTNRTFAAAVKRREESEPWERHRDLYDQERERQVHPYDRKVESHSVKNRCKTMRN